MQTYDLKQRKEFLANLELDEPSFANPDLGFRALGSKDFELGTLSFSEGQKEGFVNAGSLVAFTAGCTRRHKKDLLNSTLLAQLAANRAHDRFNDTANWLRFYANVLENIGWVIQNRSFTQFNAAGAEFTVDRVVLDILAAIATGNEIAIVQETINALRNLSDDDGRLVLFERSSHSLTKGNFQIVAADESDGELVMKFGGFSFSSTENVTKVLFFRFSSATANLFHLADTIVLNEEVHDEVRDDIVDRLGDRAEEFVKNLPI